MNADQHIKNMNAYQVMKKPECWSSDEKKAWMLIKRRKIMNTAQVINKHEFRQSEKIMNADQVKKASIRTKWNSSMNVEKNVASDLDNISPVEKTRILQTIQQWLEQSKIKSVILKIHFTKYIFNFPLPGRNLLFWRTTASEVSSQPAWHKKHF
jgi:hypothetical protein